MIRVIDDVNIRMIINIHYKYIGINDLLKVYLLVE